MIDVRATLDELEEKRSEQGRFFRSDGTHLDAEANHAFNHALLLKLDSSSAATLEAVADTAAEPNEDEVSGTTLRASTPPPKHRYRHHHQKRDTRQTKRAHPEAGQKTTKAKTSRAKLDKHSRTTHKESTRHSTKGRSG